MASDLQVCVCIFYKHAAGERFAVSPRGLSTSAQSEAEVLLLPLPEVLVLAEADSLAASVLALAAAAGAAPVDVAALLPVERPSSRMMSLRNCCRLRAPMCA